MHCLNSSLFIRHLKAFLFHLDYIQECLTDDWECSLVLNVWSALQVSRIACIRLLRCTFKTCACQSQPLPVAVTCVQLLAVTYKSWQPKLTFGPRSFASSAPKLWNSLPLPLRNSTLILRQFGSRLKTYLSSLAYGCAS